MPSPCGNSVTRARYGHIGSLKSCVVRSSKAAIGGKPCNAGVFQVASDELPHVVQLLSGRLVLLGVLFASNCVQLTFASLNKLLGALQYSGEKMIILINLVTKF